MTALTDAEILRRIENLLESFDNLIADRALGEHDPYLTTRREAQEAYEVLWRRVNG